MFQFYLWFIQKAGRAIFLVDAYAAVDQPKNADPRNPMATLGHNRTSNLNTVLNSWGVALKGGGVVGDMNYAASVSSGPRNAPPIRFPVWLSLNSETMNQESIITSDLNNLVLPWPGSLELTEVEGLKSEILFKSSKQAMVYDANDIRFSAQDPKALLKNFTPGDQEQILAVQLSGLFKSAYDKSPVEAPVQENVSIESSHISKGNKKSSVIVVADADFISDHFSAVTQNILGNKIVSLLNDNIIFLANAIDNLSGSENLISLRSRGTFTRPFTTVQKIESDAQEKYKQEEVLIQAKLNQANQRLQQLQSGSNSPQGSAVFNKAMVSEIQKFRDERKNAQQNLRQVRLKLRERKEGLGTRLLVLNTFFIPFILILGTLFNYFRKSKITRTYSND